MHFDSETVNLVLIVLFGISEALAQIPAVKANSVFQMLKNALGVLTGKKSEEKKAE